MLLETIEERASEYAYTEWVSDLVDVAKESYTKGATEQREIDVMRIRHFLEREAAYNGTMSCVDDLLIEELCKIIEEEEL